MEAVTVPWKRRSIWKRTALLVALLAIAWYASALAAGYALSRRFADPAPEAGVPDCDMHAEGLVLETSDGTVIRAWLFAPDAAGASVVMLHGWRGSRSTVGQRAEALARSGHAVLAPSLRAHGDSAGDRYDFGAEAWRDVAACIDELRRRRPKQPIVLVGFSYGAAVAVETALRRPDDVDALVLDSLFADLACAVRHRCEIRLPWGLDHLASWGLTAAAPVVFPHLDKIAPAISCQGLDPRIRALLMRGSLDERVAPIESEEIARALGDRARTVVQAGADHDRCFEHDPPGWVASVGAFLETVTTRR